MSNLTYIPHHPATGGDYVRIKYRPITEDNQELRARWSWAVQLRSGNSKLPRFLLVTRNGENIIPDRVKGNEIIETLSYLIGAPLEIRSAEINLPFEILLLKMRRGL